MAVIPEELLELSLEPVQPRWLEYGMVAKQFGCPTCGTIRTLPVGKDRQDERPFCIHDDGNYAWHQDLDGNWTEMFEVVVIPKHVIN